MDAIKILEVVETIDNLPQEDIDFMEVEINQSFHFMDKIIHFFKEGMDMVEEVEVH